MKKLFAIVAVIGVFTFGSTQLAQAQDARCCRTELQGRQSIAPAADSYAAVELHATCCAGEEGGIHKEIKD